MTPRTSLAAILLGLVFWPPSAMSLSIKQVFAEDVRFENGAVALSADERGKIYRKLDEVRAKSGCTEFVVVVGYASKKFEGSGPEASRLAMERARYVGARIAGAGVPASIIHPQIPGGLPNGGCRTDAEGCVQIEIQTFRPGFCS